jgi:hypothetical protein
VRLSRVGLSVAGHVASVEIFIHLFEYSSGEGRDTLNTSRDVSK